MRAAIWPYRISHEPTFSLSVSLIHHLRWSPFPQGKAIPHFTVTMRKEYLPKTQNLKPLSQQLRKIATSEENHLWYDFLRSHPVQFRRQYVIGHYIVDFYCAKANLVIELDGIQHTFEENEANDLERTAFLENLGLTVLRFYNGDVNYVFDTVCRTIDGILREKLGYDPYP